MEPLNPWQVISIVSVSVPTDYWQIKALSASSHITLKPSFQSHQLEITTAETVIPETTACGHA